MDATTQNPESPSAGAELSLLATLRQFPRPVWILYAGTFINKFGTFVLPFLALHLTRQGYSAGKAGLCMVAYGVGHFAASVVGGHLADTIGRRRSIVLSMFSGAASIMLLSQADHLATFAVFAFLTGLTAEFYKPASSALLADFVPVEHRVTAYAGYRFAINAGWALGPAVAGLLAKHSYFWLFLGDAATAVAFGFVALFWLPKEAERQADHRVSAWNPFDSVIGVARTALKDERFVRLIAATLLTAVVFVQMATTLGVQIKAAGYSEWIYGLVLALNGGIVVLCEVPLSAFTRRWSPRPVIAIGSALIGLGAGLNAWASTAGHYALAMVVLTVGEIISMSVSLAYAASLAPETMRGRYLGLYGLTWATAIAAGPGIGLWLFSVQPFALWIGCGVLGLLASAIIGVPLRSPSCRPALASAEAPISLQQQDS